jgi:non-ribosomal peptide synthetase component F
MTSSFYLLRQLCDITQRHPQKVAVVLDDQTWTYSELIEQIERVVYHLHHLNIVQGQIIYQFVERGFEMVCGLFGIMFAGGVYCSLNPTDPHQRLISIIEQMQSQYVLLHRKTLNQLPVTANQHVVLLDDILSPLLCVKDVDDLPDCKEDGAAFIVCTSGTTGRSKAVLHTFKSLSAGILIYDQWDLGLYTSQTHVLQIATSSWVLHVMEIVTSLVLGGTLVLLRPGGHLDMDYLSQTLIDQQVTTIITGPGIIRALINYLEMSQRFETFKFLRNCSMTGNCETSICSERYVFFIHLDLT